MLKHIKFILPVLLSVTLLGILAEAWEVVIITFAAGIILGIPYGFLLSEAANFLERNDENS